MDHNPVITAIKAVGLLNDLAQKAKNGIIPFSKCSSGNSDEWKHAIVYLDETDDGTACMGQNDVIADMLVDDESGHHDAVSGYAGVLSELCGCNVSMTAECDGDGDWWFVCVTIRTAGGNLDLVIDEDGWSIV